MHWEAQWDPADHPIYLHIVPALADTFMKMTWYEKVLLVVQTPVVVPLRLCVPVVNEELENKGWVRPVAVLQMFLLPLLVAGFVATQLLPKAGQFNLAWTFFIYGVGLVVGTTMGVLVWLLAEDHTPPPWHRKLALVGFIAATMFIYMAAVEIVNIVLACGTILEIDNFLLGVTILSVFMGTQDLVSNVAVANAGYPNMAASACVGSPILNMLVGLGLCAVAGTCPCSLSLPPSLCLSLLVGLGLCAVAGTPSLSTVVSPCSTTPPFLAHGLTCGLVACPGGISLASRLASGSCFLGSLVFLSLRSLVELASGSLVLALIR